MEISILYKNSDVGGINVQRDMELIRKIMLTIEEQYVDVVLYNIEIKGYDLKTIAYHCDILHQAGLVSVYGGDYGSNELVSFGVGSLTWEGHNYLDKIKDDKIWNKTKCTIKEKGIPFAFETVKQVASIIISSMFESVI